MHYEFNPDDVKRFIDHVGIPTYQRGNELTFKYCPYCRGSEKDKKTFSINMDTGVFQCFRSSCGAKGNMIRLAKDFGFSLSNGYDPTAIHKRATFWRKFQKKEPKPKAVEYLESRGISQAIAEKYNITCQNEDENILVFPFVDEHGMLQMVKYRNIDPERKGSKEWSQKGGISILFGMVQCNFDNKTLIITEGQIDSLSVAECGFENAVSVPTGKNGFTWYPICFDFMHRFNEFIVFGDNENGSITLLDDIYNHLKRTGTVKHVRIDDYMGHKDANELLMAEGREAVKKAIENAVPVPNKRIRMVSDIQESNLDEKPKFSTGFQSLDNLLGGGFYFGQVAILTGARGDGKSTLGSQFIINAIAQGFNSMVYSGELPEWQFKNWVNRQIAGPNAIIEGNQDYYVDRINSLKISTWYRNRFFLVGDEIETEEDEDHQTLMEILESAVYQYECKVIMIDNLMTALEDDMASDLYRQQTRFVKTLVNFARNTNTFILLIAHPRKNNGTNFSNDSISGSGNIMNLAQVIIRYFRPQPAEDGSVPCDRKLSLTKNRNTGRLNESGIDLYFDERSKRISERFNDFSWDLGWNDVDQGFIPIEDDDLPDEIPF